MRTNLVLVAALLSGCANPIFDVGRTETVLPLTRAWIDGRVAEYVTTDISDQTMATMMGANFVPRLALTAKAAPGSSVLERVYRFPKEEQINVFQSAPDPIGAANRDKGYSPLWRLVLVTWVDRSRTRELKSEEEILAAEERREVALDVTDIVVNCPIVRDRRGRYLQGVR